MGDGLGEVSGEKNEKTNRQVPLHSHLAPLSKPSMEAHVSHPLCSPEEPKIKIQTQTTATTQIMGTLLVCVCVCVWKNKETYEKFPSH